MFPVNAMPGTKVVGGYKCDGYRLTLGSSVLDVYLTRRIGASVAAFTDFLEWSGAAQSMAELIEALRKLPGFPLEMRSRVDVLGEIHETVAIVANVKVGPLPDSLFLPPLGWTVVEESQAEQE